MGTERKNIRDTDNNKDEIRRRGGKASESQTNDAGSASMDINARTNDHGAILSRVQSDEQRANMTLRLQRSYGNSYVRHILNTVSTPAEHTISRGAPLAPTGPIPGSPEEEQLNGIYGASTRPRPTRPGGTQQPAAEQIESSNVSPVPPAPATAPGTAEQQPAPGTGQAAEQIESSNVPPVPPAPATAPGTAEQRPAPGTALQSTIEQIESNRVPPVPPASATAPGTAEQQPAPGTGPAAEQQVTPGTAVTPEGPNGATGAASPISSSQAAIRAVWANQVSNQVRNAYYSLIGSGTEEERATDARNYLNDAMNVIPTIRDAYQNDPDLFGQIAYAQASLEGWIAAVSPIAGYNITLESIADVINPSENNGRFAAINNIGERL